LASPKSTEGAAIQSYRNLAKIKVLTRVKPATHKEFQTSAHGPQKLRRKTPEDPMQHQLIEFGPILKGRFLERPNRFLMRCDVDSLGRLDAFLPNPGRLWELLLPNATVYFTTEPDSSPVRHSQRKTEYTVLAVERDGSPVFLHTHLTNRVAQRLIEEGRIPGLEGAQIVKPEYSVGNSRFDFLLDQDGRRILLEVKSCTLFGNGVAMFPDAVTERGRRHLEELASISKPRQRPYVLFLVHTPRARWFMPDYHTDLAFSQTLLAVRKKIEIIPASIAWTPDLSLSGQVKRLEIPWHYLQREVKDRGSYLLVARLDKERQLEVGRLGTFPFHRGYYIYVGSAMQNLSARIARHLRRTKKLHWHIDYLCQGASHLVAHPIRSSRRDECGIARTLAEVFAPGPPGFGSSDCHCPTHLFWHGNNPLEESSFHTILHRFRMRPPKPSTF
jgi:sugar fermentation stimulation protein A